MELTIFVICLLLSIYIFATYLQGANLCKSFFSSSELINLFAQLILACLLLNCICVIDLRGTVNGAWSTDGCTLLLINSSRVTCHCNHLTNFALLLRVDSDSVVVSEAY